MMILMIMILLNDHMISKLCENILTRAENLHSWPYRTTFTDSGPFNGFSFSFTLSFYLLFNHTLNIYILNLI